MEFQTEPIKVNVGAMNRRHERSILSEPTNPRSNLNTIMLTVVIGLLGFNGWGTLTNMVKLASIEAAQVSRSEISAKDAAVQLQIIELSRDVQSQRLDLTKLQITIQRMTDMK